MNKFYLKQSFLFLITIWFTLKCFSQKTDYSVFKKKYDYYFKENKLDSALYFAKQMNVCTLKNEGDSSLRYAVSFRYIGNCFDKLGIIDSNLFYLNESLRVLERQKRTNDIDFAKCSYNLGRIYLKNIFDLKLAYKYTSQAIKIFEEFYGIENHDFLKTYYLLGMIYHEMGSYMKSESIYLHCLHKNTTQIEKIQISNNLGNLYRDMGDNEKAEFFFISAKKDYFKFFGGNDNFYAGIINDIGGFYFLIGDYHNAEKQLIESNNIFSKNELFDNNYRINLCKLGDLYKILGDIQVSEQYYQKAIDIFENDGYLLNPIYARCYLSIGSLYLMKNDRKKADLYFEKSIDLQEKLHGKKHRDYARCLQTIAYKYELYGRYEKAKKYLEDAILIYKKTIGNTHPEYLNTLKMLGGVNFLLGDIETALVQIEDVTNKTKNFNKTEYCMNLYSLGYFYSKKGDFKKANIAYSESFNIRSKTIALDLFWLSSNQKKKFWLNEYSYFEQLFDFSPIAYNANTSSTILTYNSCIISKSFLLETSRDFDKAILNSTDKELKSQFEEIKLLRRCISKMESEGSDKKEIIQLYNQKTDSLDKILVTKLGEYANAKHKFEVTWKEVQTNLLSTEAAIEFAKYFDYKDSVYKYMALVVRSGYEYPKLVKLGNEVNIKNASSQKDFSELYKYVWSGIDSLITGVKTIYYSPVGELNNISFSALISENKNQLDSSSSNWSYLIDRYDLNQVTTTRYLADGTFKKNDSIPLSINLIGGVNYSDLPFSKDSIDINETTEDYALQINLQNELNNPKIDRGGKINYLKGSEIEVKEIAKTLKNSGWETTISDGKNASEYQFKKELNVKSPGIIHISTHGFAFPEKETRDKNDFQIKETKTYKVSEDPMVRCGLMFSGANISWNGDSKKMIETTGDDGILTAAEVANLDLSNTKLVVLSACETGLGKIESSEGTFGLKRGFKLAGVDQIIVSLWKVPDNETKELMTLFYSELSKTENIELSFNNAQKEMRNRYPFEPEKWAGFVLVR